MHRRGSTGNEEDFSRLDAMNTEMWFHPVVQRNLRWIAELGCYTVVEPVEKRLACRDIGVGAMAEVQEDLETVERQEPPLKSARSHTRFSGSASPSHRRVYSSTRRFPCSPI